MLGRVTFKPEWLHTYIQTVQLLCFKFMFLIVGIIIFSYHYIVSRYTYVQVHRTVGDDLYEDVRLGWS